MNEIICADCLDILKSMPDKSVDLVLTDPPYGINMRSDGVAKINPWADRVNAALWYATWMSEVRRLLKPTGCLWTMLNWRSFVTYQKAADDLFWSIESLLVWDKKWIGPGGCVGLRPSYEMVALFAMPQFAIPDRGQRDIVAVQWSAYKPTGHPAEKPVELMRHLIGISGLSKDAVILDPFCGSGTTCVAAKAMGYRYIGIELNENYAAIARKRVEQAQYEEQLFTKEAMV